ncbi:MAG: diacylglycerol kinase family protein [Bacteroidota bacterium]|nr:diacylglycerol kinase family protein [Bacteroidota bacterium]
MKRFYQSFLYALNGLILLVKTERNFQIIVGCMVVTLIVGFGLDYFGQHLTRFEWAVLWLAMGSIFVSEALNSALEEALDSLHPDKAEGIGKAKDMAAAATMLASTVAIIVGLYILLPRIVAVFMGY